MSKVSQNEKVLSWALFNSSPESLKEALTPIFQQYNEFKPIGRELIFIQETKQINKKKNIRVSGYATGWKTIRVDLLLHARSEEGSEGLIFVETKLSLKNLHKSVVQAGKYPPGFITTGFIDNHHPRGRFYYELLREIFNYHGLESILTRRTKNQPYLNLHPVIAIPLKKELNISEIEPVHFTKGLTDSCNKYALEIHPVTLWPLDEEYINQITTLLIEDRWQTVISKYLELKQQTEVLKECLKEKKVIKFITERNGNSMLSLYPKGSMISHVQSNAKVIPEKELTPLKILEMLNTDKSRRVIVHYYLTGVNLPVFYLEINKDRYLGFQLNSTTEVYINCFYNEHIVNDAIPIIDKPELDMTLAIFSGKYRTERLLKKTAISIKIMMKGHWMSGKEETMEWWILCPKVMKARADNKVRPIFSIKKAKKLVNDDELSIFHFNRPFNFISAGIRLRRVNTSSMESPYKN
ncbi:MAG: hypothetical protein ACTSRU_17990 [Candidatus Hodarchaeales archaeon]